MSPRRARVDSGAASGWFTRANCVLAQTGGLMPSSTSDRDTLRQAKPSASQASRLLCHLRCVQALEEVFAESAFLDDLKSELRGGVESFAKGHAECSLQQLES